MKVTSAPSYCYEACKIRERVDGSMKNILDKGLSKADRFHSEGYGNGFNFESKSGHWNLVVEPGGKQPQSFDYHFELTDTKIFGYSGPFREVEDLSYRLQADGGKVYQSRHWSKGDGLITNNFAEVKVAANGQMSCQVRDESPKFSNWLRQNPSANKLAAMSIGGVVGAAVGGFLGGSAVATCTAPIGAALGGMFAKGFEADNCDAPRADRERSLYRPVQILQNCVTGGGVLGAVGLLAVLL